MFNGKAFIVFLSIFLAGGVAGHFVGLRVACERYKRQSSAVSPAQTAQRRPIEEWSQRFKKEFDEHIVTTPAQQAQIDPIVNEAQIEFRTLRERFGRQAADVSEKLDARIMAVLDEAQRPRYQQMINERLERFRKKEAERAAAARDERPVGAH